MPSLLNSNQLNLLTGTFQSHFETFSTGINNYVTVYKQPIQQINNISSNNIYGYGTDNNGSNTDITYIEVSRQIPCQIIYPKDLSQNPLTQVRTNIDTSNLMIKVDASGASYIDNGKNERFLVNGTFYNQEVGASSVQNYFGLKFFYYKLNVTS